MNTDRLDAEEELMEKLTGVRPSRWLKKRRRKAIALSARKIFPRLRKRDRELEKMIQDFSFGGNVHFPCAVDEFPTAQDILHKLSFLPFSAEIAKPESQKPVECATCGEIKPVTAFYNYGSPSCRECNTKGSRGTL